MWHWLLWTALVLIPGSVFAGDVAAFDLIGPRMEVTVTREGRTLPIAEVPNLQSGDRIWIHPGLPDDQRARYLMVVAFLRGATNPPPDAWFTRAETWSKLVREEGIVVTVPQGAQQALIFLAPQTGGDFATLRSAVQGKPGAFVRAAQDLQLVSLNRARLEKYLAAIRDSDHVVRVGRGPCWNIRRRRRIAQTGRSDRRLGTRRGEGEINANQVCRDAPAGAARILAIRADTAKRVVGARLEPFGGDWQRFRISDAAGG